MKYLLKVFFALVLILFLIRHIRFDENYFLTSLISFTSPNTTPSQSVFPVHTSQTKVENKKIYIYNTHQQEQYKTNTVMDAANYLKLLLETKGYTVIFEETSFDEYKITHEMDLTETYPTSRIFLEKNIREYGPFDLIIDFHRDALPRESSYIINNNQSYAKMMMVIGGASSNSDSVLYNSQVLHQAVDEIIPGIMRTDFFRSNTVYNQDYTKGMLLIEVGGHQNEYEEILRTLEILAQAIDVCLKEGRFI